MQDTLIINDVKYTKVPENYEDVEKELNDIKRKVNELCAMLEDEEQQAVDICNEKKALGLSINAIESEGFLRGIISARSLLDYVFDATA